MNPAYEIILMEYAAGTLDLAQRLLVTAHLNLSPQGRTIVREYECVGGALMEKSCDPVSMSASSLENVLNRIDLKPQRQEPQQRQRTIPEDAPLPTCFEEYIICRPGRRVEWRTVQPGIDFFALPLQCRRSSAGMLRLLPGIATPRHRHRGLELTLVLDGAFMDDNGTHETGSLIVNDADDPSHAATSCENKGCVCITVTTGSLHFDSLWGRLLGPFIRF